MNQSINQSINNEGRPSACGREQTRSSFRPRACRIIRFAQTRQLWRALRQGGGMLGEGRYMYMYECMK